MPIIAAVGQAVGLAGNAVKSMVTRAREKKAAKRAFKASEKAKQAQSAMQEKLQRIGIDPVLTQSSVMDRYEKAGNAVASIMEPRPKINLGMFAGIAAAVLLLFMLMKKR